MLLALALGACASAGGGQASAPETSPTPARSAEADAYIADAVDIMRREALHRQDIDFDALHDSIRQGAAGAQTSEDTYPAIRQALPLLRDHHSSFLTFDQLNEYMGLTREDMVDVRAGRPPHVDPDALDDLRASLEYASGRIVSENVGYLRVPEFESLTAEGMTFLADSLQNMIRQFDREGVEGWVVDLRGNRGGAAMPMITGLGPLLDDDNEFATVDAQGVTLGRAYYRAGGYYDVATGEPEGEPLVRSTVQHRVPDPTRIAILTDASTASSAEAVVVVFAGQPNVQIIGQRTAGLTSTNSFHVLSDDAVLNITVGHYADRRGTVYLQGVEPDVLVQASEPGDASDLVLETALARLAR